MMVRNLHIHELMLDIWKLWKVLNDQYEKFLVKIFHLIDMISGFFLQDICPCVYNLHFDKASQNEASCFSAKTQTYLLLICLI